MKTVWQWRNRASNRPWETIGDGKKPTIFWLQMEYREVKDLSR